MTQNILADVRTCLNDVLDTMFNNTLDSATTSSDNGGLLSAQALKSMMNKRKLVYQDAIDEENSNESAKRLCTTNGNQHEQKP